MGQTGDDMLEVTSHVGAPPGAVFAWHERPGALERLTPPWERFQVVERRGGIRDGDRMVARVHLGPLFRTWEAVHRDYEPGRQFRDEQARGPFARWVHTHRMEPDGQGGTRLVDRVEYRLPLGVLGHMVAGRAVRRKIERMFRYRHAVTVGDMARHQQVAGQGEKRIAITGASGLVGSSLARFLTTGGHRVARVVRRRGAVGEGDVYWSPAEGEIDAAALEGVDAVVHLAGENLAAGRWTDERRRRILESRVQGTRLLAEALAKLERKPSVLVSMSAVGYYGDTGEEPVDETAPSGEGFLAEVCREWEAAAQPARDAGIRVVHPRMGVVLSPEGGALAKMLPVFKLGLGGKLGKGDQFMSWIALDDALGALHHAVFEETLEGPANAVAPESVTNHEFTKTLGKVLGRPAVFTVPGAALKLGLGQGLAEEALLWGQRAVPARLTNTGFEWRYPRLEGALRHLLGR